MGSGVLYPDFQADGSQLFPYLKISLSLRGLPGKAVVQKIPLFYCLSVFEAWEDLKIGDDSLAGVSGHLEASTLTCLEVNAGCWLRPYLEHIRCGPFS